MGVFTAVIRGRSSIIAVLKVQGFRAAGMLEISTAVLWRGAGSPELLRDSSAHLAKSKTEPLAPIHLDTGHRLAKPGLVPV